MSARVDTGGVTVRLAYNPATPVQACLMRSKQTTAPSVRLAVGSLHERAPRTALQATTKRLPALLVSYAYLQPFLTNRHRYPYRDWVMDSGAFSAANSGRVIDLDEYIATCRHLMDTDPSLVEIFSLDVIGDHRKSAEYAAAMWKAGIPVIPCFHYGEPESALLEMAAAYPKIAIGGVAYKRGTGKLRWAEQVFARVWPKRIHGFAFASEAAVMGLPFHSTDSSSWEIGACGFGNWKTFGDLQVRGSNQDLRGEVNAYLDLEERARVKWAAADARARRHRSGCPVGGRQGVRPRRIDGDMIDLHQARDHVRAILEAFGHDIRREGLERTPDRVATFYLEFLAARPLCRVTTFDAEGAAEMIVVRQVPFYSLCEHHLLPFFGTGTVGYVPNGRIVGLSKIPRIVAHFARGIQNQERLSNQIADCLVETLAPKGVGVILHGRHLCMEMRGVGIAGAVTTTSALRGVVLDDASARREFLDFDAKNGH
jgi:GTP cyclohydrolase IA